MANYPKQIVPPFNKDDIKEIVQDGIVNGDIILPPAEGGAKLYKHTITWTENGSTGEITWYSNISEPATNYADICKNAIYGYYADPTYMSSPLEGVILRNTTDNPSAASCYLILMAGKKFGSASGSSVNVYEKNFNKTITDTVTEL